MQYDASGADVSQRQATADSALEKMRRGFCLKSELTSAEKRYVTEKLENASVITVSSAGLHGGRHYSIYDLVGHSVKGMTYLVTNHSAFNGYMSARLENDFMVKNPEPHSRIKASFTAFMHENKLHWSGCCGKKTESSKSVRRKLRLLSEKTGKSSGQILSKLVDDELKRTFVEAS